jgi:hypothetical protein
MSRHYPTNLRLQSAIVLQNGEHGGKNMPFEVDSCLEAGEKSLDSIPPCLKLHEREELLCGRILADRSLGKYASSPSGRYLEALHFGPQFFPRQRLF